MTKKKKTIIAVSVIGGVLLTAAVLAFIIRVGFWFLFPTTQGVRNRMSRYYEQCEYVTLSGKLETYYEFDYGLRFTITLDDECILSVVKEQNLSSFYGNGLKLPTVTYDFPTNSKKVLQENGFYDLLTTDEDGHCNLNETVTIIVNNSIWWDGGIPFAVGLSVGDTVYLDFETGKELLIDYIQHDMY